ncbi:hypothetical protein, variant 2 [Saprolegnia diclina VS20]|uniref:Thioredoxin n=1 Tax=Saprolegnia diclina (strain VS20) TaxID=1156394 RepID=T0PQ55_SAPDV|nr:hypothetical protein SDRG_14661 [Saprolegnia diclina VS20]XP_008619030.1 hypothetical protein, variant 1 [Saprolegnia diclina VS20]XP_008619031.1 hypothetical protein, variant 2 [Saprolegnia diclina VS20]EQC27609.1 hypothetical protein SDRG_14661 [Saprolegnia diclina VS20]EQC27610.1 hypothetical protein, variant 1 [Saprolegnia diclina VS20]EQC27611.1 hypothetical protein, variant 2 [Saprolegnia diclina VS20]|eukprot:XP_008619029.1 hypothetical protein SDRG_14661 [Saprolegnia diclina VS20]
MSSVQELHFSSEAAFRDEITLDKYKDRLVVVDFSAVWCPPCQYIKPIFRDFAKDLPEAAFIEVDVDESDELSAAVGIRAMPTFQFYRNGKKIDTMTGADPTGLKRLLHQHK